jgi:hypothetical protein
VVTSPGASAVRPPAPRTTEMIPHMVAESTNPSHPTAPAQLPEVMEVATERLRS